MTPIRLLLAFDGSEEAAEAARAAGRLLRGAEAVVLFSQHAADEAAREVAEAGRALAEQAGLDASAAVAVGSSPWRAISAAAVEHEADVIVCGTRGRSGLSRALLGSTSSSLLYHATVPVLVVPPGDGEPSGPVLIGYDGSDGAREAVRGAARLLGGRSALVAHAWSSPVQRSLVGSSLLSAPLEEVQEIAGDLDDMFAGGARDTADEGAALAREHGLDARALTIEAVPGTWQALAAAATREHAALIVAGSRGQGALASTVLGSVSAGLVHNAELPVLIVRGAG